MPPSFFCAIKWAYSMSWGERGFATLFTFGLAAILGPRDFGVLAIAMIYISFIEMLLNQGIVAAIIQREDLRPEHLDSIFWFDLVLCAILLGVSVTLSGWWARINRLPELSLVICVLSVRLPIEALGIVPRALLQRAMDFKSLSLRSNVSALGGGIVGVVMALEGFGVWALVGQRLTQDVLAAVLLWISTRWRPGRGFCLHRLKEILRFSSAGFWGGIGTFAHDQADAFLMGIFFGPITIGLYRLAQRLMFLVHDVATNSLQVVSLSQFSRFQNEPSELRRSVSAFIRLSVTITLPAMAGLAMTSELIMAVIGPAWAAASDPLKVWCLLGMTLAFVNFTGPLLTALSKPLLMSLLTWILTVVNVGALVLASLLLSGLTAWWQVMGIALTRLAVGALVMMPLYILLLIRYSGVSLLELLRATVPALFGVGVIGIVVPLLSASKFVAAQPAIIALVLLTSIAGLLVLLTVIILDAHVRDYAFSFYTRRRRGHETNTPGRISPNPVPGIRLDPEGTSGIWRRGG
jgi:O-antigen/teichoic acid export membrane protein